MDQGTQQSRSKGFTFFNLEVGQPTQEMITKRRRLSETGSESTEEKHMNESFGKLEIKGNNSLLSNLSTGSDQLRIQVKPCIPMPIRINKFNSQNMIRDSKPKILKHLFMEKMGIQKYLTLDCDQKLSDILQKQKIMMDVPIVQHIKPKFYYPYGVPANFDFLIQEGERFLKQNIETQSELYKEQTERDLFINNLDMTRIPKISKEERAKKVELYLLKKQNRQWRAIRYETRKNLAQQRERMQGRFVKSDKPKYQWLATQEENNLMSCSDRSSQVQDRKEEKDLRKSMEVLRSSAKFT